MKYVTLVMDHSDDPSHPYGPGTPAPYPFHIGSAGQVLRQDVWEGWPSRILGFMPDGSQAQKEDDICLTVDEFLADPKQAEGLYPVMVLGDNEYCALAGSKVLAIATGESEVDFK